MASLRLFLTIAAARDLELCQLDIDTMFLDAPIKEDVYIRQPLGFIDGTSKVCHPRRCLYSMKQSRREFDMLLRAWLLVSYPSPFSKVLVYDIIYFLYMVPVS
jgi:hypothetical protein